LSDSFLILALSDTIVGFRDWTATHRGIWKWSDVGGTPAGLETTVGYVFVGVSDPDAGVIDMPSPPDTRSKVTT